MVAVAVAPPDDPGSVPLIVAPPVETVVTENEADCAPAAMVTLAGTVATAGFDDERVTTVFATSRTFVTAERVGFVPRVTLCAGGVSDSEGTGTWIEPPFNTSPFEDDSVVVPPWLLSCVLEESRTSASEVPGVADEERVKTRCAT